MIKPRQWVSFRVAFRSSSSPHHHQTAPFKAFPRAYTYNNNMLKCLGKPNKKSSKASSTPSRGLFVNGSRRSQLQLTIPQMSRSHLMTLYRVGCDILGESSCSPQLYRPLDYERGRDPNRLEFKVGVMRLLNITTTGDRCCRRCCWLSLTRRITSPA